MQFNSINFLIFFPIVLFFYFFLPRKCRTLLLLIASYFFYMYSQPALIVLILFTTLVSWVSSLVIEKLDLKIASGALSEKEIARARRQNLLTVFCCLIIAMIAGRLVWGVAEIVLLGVRGDAFTWQAFLAGAVLNAIPGIILQLVLIPPVVAALKKAKLMLNE